MERFASVCRHTEETKVDVEILLDGTGNREISTGIPFFDHMLNLFAVHGFFDLKVEAKGDIDVDFHHTVEDVGIVLGNAVSKALGEKVGIRRYGFALTPMDEALARSVIDLSNRPYLVFKVPPVAASETGFGVQLAKEFFRAFAVNAGMTLHINVEYGENEHHVIESVFKSVIESVFKSVARALDMAVGLDDRITGQLSTKGCI
ncbi:MAG: imidazoleglycerol-phosphate dehydratase [Desulfococcus sp. 4484_241]|nr:MAG: imidazoleglycerol-phosphate dehydratase [Desulfococcus sp. 4484_241]